MQADAWVLLELPSLLTIVRRRALHSVSTYQGREANLNVQQVLAVFELVQLQLKLEDALLADWQVVLMAAGTDRLHVMHQVILVHQLC